MSLSEIQKRLMELKRNRKTVILAHNYQLPEIQDVADIVADSLGLAREATRIDAEEVVVCGVYFMAETVAILNPKKRVLIPDPDAGCPLADFATPEMVREWRKKYPDYAFVTYVNSSAEVKALSDVCCTSANAEKIVRAVPNDKIVFLPDKNLGAFVASRVPEKEIVLWPGFCVVHETASLDAVIEAKQAHPQARVLAHPECPKDFWPVADALLSTGQMFDDVAKHPEVKEFILVTEWGIKAGLSKRFPGRMFIEPGKRMECRNMKKITLPKLEKSLTSGVFEVKVDERVAEAARVSIEKMLDWSK